MEPKDSWRLVQAIVIVQGLASALPWNVYVTESEFFTLRVHVPPFHRALADNFENAQLLTSQAANTLGFLIYVPCQRYMSMDAQVLHPQLLTLAVMASGAWLTLALGLGGNAVALITLGSQVIIGLTNATITGGVYAMAAWLPPLYLQGMSLGIGLSGFIVSAISFVTVWWCPPALKHRKTPAEAAPEAFGYFLLSCAIIAAGIVTYFIYFQTAFVKWHRRPKVLGEWEWRPDPEMAPREAVRSCAAMSSIPAHLDQPLLSKTSAAHGAYQEGSTLRRLEGEDLGMGEVLGRMSGYLVVAFLNLFVTSSAFPGLTSAICSRWNAADLAPCSALSPRGRFYGDLWAPFVFTLFNGGDLAGRLLAGVGPWRAAPPPLPTLIAYSAARAALVVGLVFCNVVTPSPWRLPVLLRLDVWPVLLTLALGVTNGHTQALAMMHAPSSLPRGPARERCGPLLNGMLCLGCTAGSVVACAITYCFQRGA